jgi:hypothetical protein
LNKKDGRYVVKEPVKPKTCVQPPLAGLSYGGVEAWDERGEKVNADDRSLGTFMFSLLA